jgi:hypothetical protein
LFFFLSFKELATVLLKVVSRKRRRKCTLKSYDRFTKYLRFEKLRGPNLFTSYQFAKFKDQINIGLGY